MLYPLSYEGLARGYGRGQPVKFSIFLVYFHIVDPDIQELKELIKRVGALAEDTNNTVHKMYRAQVWSRVVSYLWWGAIILFTGSVYYYFLWPTLNQLMELYAGVQSGASQAQGFGSQIQEVLRQYGF